MKKIIYLIAGLFIFSACETPCECETPKSGFITGSDQSVMLGSDESIEIFKTIDAAWQSRDSVSYTHLRAHETREYIV